MNMQKIIENIVTHVENNLSGVWTDEAIALFEKHAGKPPYNRFLNEYIYDDNLRQRLILSLPNIFENRKHKNILSAQYYNNNKAGRLRKSDPMCMVDTKKRLLKKIGNKNSPVITDEPDYDEGKHEVYTYTLPLDTKTKVRADEIVDNEKIQFVLNGDDDVVTYRVDKVVRNEKTTTSGYVLLRRV